MWGGLLLNRRPLVVGLDILGYSAVLFSKLKLNADVIPRRATVFSFRISQRVYYLRSRPEVSCAWFCLAFLLLGALFIIYQFIDIGYFAFAIDVDFKRG